MQQIKEQQRGWERQWQQDTKQRPPESNGDAKGNLKGAMKGKHNLGISDGAGRSSIGHSKSPLTKPMGTYFFKLNDTSLSYQGGGGKKYSLQLTHDTTVSTSQEGNGYFFCIITPRKRLKAAAASMQEAANWAEAIQKKIDSFSRGAAAGKGGVGGGAARCRDVKGGSGE
jgi:hypothetical protein